MDKIYDANFATALLIKDRQVLLCRVYNENSPGFLITMVENDASAVMTAAHAIRENFNITFNDSDLTPLATVHADILKDRAYILENDIFTLTSWEGELVPINPTTGIAEIKWAQLPDLSLGIADNVFNGYIITELKDKDLVS